MRLAVFGYSEAFQVPNCSRWAGDGSLQDLFEIVDEEHALVDRDIIEVECRNLK